MSLKSYVGREGGMKKSFKQRRVLIVICAVVGFVLTILKISVIDGNKADLVVSLHYSGYSTLRFIFTILPWFCYAVAILLLVSIVVETMIQKRDEEKEQVSNAKSELTLDTPEGVYSYLQQIKIEIEKSRLNLSCPPEQDAEKWAGMVLEQLNQMDNVQTKLAELLSVNGITKLDETKDLLQDIENAICMTNVKKLINYYVVGGSTSFTAHAKGIHDENQELLGQAQGLLDDIVEFVNGGKSLDEVKNRVKSFRDTIQLFVKEEQG